MPKKQELLNRRVVGLLGENTAVRFLRLQGWRIVERNWRMGRYELDIVARDGEELVFVEVKTRKSYALENPLLALDWNKRPAFCRAAQLWCARQLTCERGTYVEGEAYRCDLLAVTYAVDSTQKIIFQVKHYVNALTE